MCYVPFVSNVVSMSFKFLTFRVPTPVWWLWSLLTKHLLDLHSPMMQDLRQLSVVKPRAVARLLSDAMLFAWRREERVQCGDLTLSWSRIAWMAGG